MTDLVKQKSYLFHADFFFLLNGISGFLKPGIYSTMTASHPAPRPHTKSAEAKLSTSSPPASLTDSSHGDSNQGLNTDEVIHKRLQQMDSGNSCWVFFSLFFFNWRIIALQYCVGLYHTSTWISHRYTYVPSLLNPLSSPTPSHPSRLSQSTGLSSLCHMANSHLLSILHMAKCIHFHTLFSARPTLSFPHCVHKSVL